MKGRTRAETATLDRYFAGLPVVEAEETLLVVVRAADVRGATKRDPTNCALARACRRLFHSRAVVIFRTVAYIDLPGENNQRVVKRFVNSPRVRSALSVLDTTNQFPPGRYEFLPVPQWRRLNVMRNADQVRRVAVINGQHVVHRNGKRSRERNPRTLEGVRDGTGMVHFTPVT